MFYKGLAILLCGCLVAGSIPQTIAAKEPVRAEAVDTGIVLLAEGDEGDSPKEEDKKEEDKKEEDKKEEDKKDDTPESKPEEKPAETKTEEKPDEGGNTPTETPTQAPTEENPENPENPTQTQTETQTDTGESPENPTQMQTETEENPENPTQTQTETEENPVSPTQTQTEEKSEPKSEEESKKVETSKVEESKKEKESKTEKESTEEASSAEESSSEEKSSEAPEEKAAKTLKNGQSTDVVLQVSNAKEQAFRFTAPSAGYYNFFVDGADVGNVKAVLYDSLTIKNQIKQRAYQDKVRYLLLYMEKGQTVYPAVSLSDGAEAGKTIKFGVKKASVASVSETEGGYTASTSAFTASIGWSPASRTVTTDIVITDKSGKGLNESYLWQIAYGNAQVGYSYAEETISPDVKKEKSIHALTASQEYSFTMYLVNSATKALEAVLVPDSNAIRLKTGASKENVVFRSVRSTYDSITIDIEAVEPVTRVSYGPLGEYDKEVSVQKYISGLGQISVSGLEPATTYYFEFYNASGAVTAYTTADTKEYPAKVNYTVKAAGPDSISIRADITAYEGTVPSSFNLCYEILDEAGKTLLSDMERTDTKGRNQWSIEAKASDLEASTQYIVKAWINEPGYTGHFKEMARTVTTDKPPFPRSALKVHIVKNTTKTGTADYTVTIDNYLKAVSGKLKYRMKDCLGEYEAADITVRKGKVKGTLTGLQEGAEYEYEVRLSGVVKRGTFKMGKAAINPELSADKGAYDAIVSYQLQSAELKKGTIYSVKPYYYNPETKLYAEAAGKLRLTASEDYTAAVQAADLMTLSPDTEYGFKWELYAGSALVQTNYQLVMTEKSEVSVKITGNTVDTITYNIAINGRTENISNDITLFTYVREGDEEYQKYGDSFNLYKSKAYKAENRSLSGLEDDKTYTISFRDIKGGEYGSFTFTFEAKIDGVLMGVTSLTAGAHSFLVQASIEGETDFDNQYAVLFFKEKEEQDWDIRSIPLEKGQTACGFDLTSYLSDDLNADTIYEFVMGVSDAAYPKTADGLKGTCSGETLTQADARSLTNVNANSGYSYISLKAALTNNPINTTSYIYVFYKESGAYEWQKSKESFIISDTTGGILTFIKDLKAGTEYDYIVAVSDSGYNTSLSEIEEDMQQSGHITTKSADITLELTADEENSTAGSERLLVKAAGAEEIKRFKAVLTLAREGDEEALYREIALSDDNGYMADVTFDGLSPETTYTVTGAELQVMETVIGECYAGTVAYLEPQYSFTTKSVQLPESIDISEEIMNIQTDTSVILSAKAQPVEASGEIVWISSDETVASVDKSGRVCAHAQGEAVITAASAYSEDIFAQCKVCVKSYAVAERYEDGSYGSSLESLTMYKGSSQSLALCEVSPDGAFTALTDYEVQSDKPGVADISDEMLTGVEVGKTDVIFQKDGIALCISVNVKAAPERFEITGLSAKDERYPAFKADSAEGALDSYEIAQKNGLKYQAQGALSPSGDFTAEAFHWSSSDEAIVEINDRGVINPVSTGTAIITVTPTEDMLEGQQYQFEIKVKALPEKKTARIFLENQKKDIKLKDIALTDYLGEGWEWKNPDTTVYRLAEHAEPYSFGVAYTGDEFYAYEGSIRVYYGSLETEKVSETVEPERTGTTAESALEVQTQESGDKTDISVSVKGITVNTAYNYRDSHGKELSAAQYGVIEVTAPAGQYIEHVELTDNSGIEPSDKLEICAYGVGSYLVRPVSEELSQDVYRCKLKIMTNAADEPYLYPLRVKVIDKKPALSAKVTKDINLFYTSDKGQLLLTPEADGMEIASVNWEDALEGAENSFKIVRSADMAENGAVCYDILQGNVAVSGERLTDERAAEGVLTVMLKGIREAYAFQLDIKTSYQKPKLRLTDYNTGARSSIVSAANANEAAIKVYDLTQKTILRYGDGSQFGYDEVSCENDSIVINAAKGYNSLRVFGSENARLTFVFGSRNWRDTVKAEYTIKNAKPSVVADKDSIVFNTAYSDEAKVNLSLKNCAGEARLSDVEIKGANKKSQQLMDNNRIALIHDGSCVLVHVAGNHGSAQKELRAGSYFYKLIPYYTDSVSGERKALNTLTLQVRLIKGSVKAHTDTDKCGDGSMRVTADFTGLGDSHRVKGARLAGEYSTYFTLQRNSYDMSIANPEFSIREAQPQMLKADKTYQISVVYTIETGSGETYEVESKKIKVKWIS